MHFDQAISLMIIATAALVLPNLAERVRIPPIVAEIIFGIFVGKSFLNIPFSNNWVLILSELGFLMLMFLAGTEVDFSMLAKRKGDDFFLFGGMLLITFLLSYGLSTLLGHGFFLALILSTTSIGLVLPVLRETGLGKSYYGQSLLLSAVLADFFTFFGITFYVLYVKFGFTWRFIAPLPIFILFGILMWGTRLWAWWNPERANSLLGHSGQSELGVRFAIALLFIFVALSEIAGIEPVLGAFMGGSLLSFAFREKAVLEDKLESIAYGFLIPFFFIRVGTEFDLKSVFHTHALIFVGKLIVVAFAVKMIPSLLFGLKKVPLKFSLAAGILLSSRLSLVVAAAAIGLREGFIGQALRDGIILLALVTSIAGPTLFRHFVAREVL